MTDTYPLGLIEKVSDVEAKEAVHARVQGAAGRAGQWRAQRRVARPGVRAVEADDPELGAAGGRGRGTPERRNDDGSVVCAGHVREASRQLAMEHVDGRRKR